MLLLQKALLERGEAMAILADPGAGENATIVRVNEAWSRSIGQPDGLMGHRVRELRGYAVQPGQWSTFATALRRYAPIQLPLHLRMERCERWLQLRLTFDEDPDGNVAHALVLARDITKLKRRETEAEATRRMIESAFPAVDVPVIVVAETGEITVSNPAFQALVGSTGEQLLGTPVGTVIAPNHQVAAAAARAKQLRDGARFELQLDLVHRAGHRVGVRMASMLVAGEDSSRLRVMTALPEPVIRPDSACADAPKLDLYGAPAQLEGEVLALSLKAVKASCGTYWTRLAPRARLIVEGSIKRRLCPDDVFSRTDDDGFIIWFDSRDSVRNAAAMASIVRDVRVRLMVELGNDIPAPATAVLMPSAPGLPNGLAINARPEGVTRSVFDRTGEPQPWCFFELLTDSRRPATVKASSFGAAADADVKCCRAALAEASAHGNWEKLFVRLTWQSLVHPGSRRLLDECLARAPSAARRRLALVISGLPPVPSPRRWSHVVTPLQRLLGDVIPCVTLAAGDPDPEGRALCALPEEWLVIDGADFRSTPPADYFRLIAHARRRGLTVLALAAPNTGTRDWFELGASLVVAAD